MGSCRSVIEFANTFVGKRGNIGVRTAKVLEHIVELGAQGVCVCRGTVVDIHKTKFIEMGWLGHLPRAMNAVRIYLWPSFSHRRFDIALFESFSLHHLKSLLRYGPYCVAHVWDYCPRLIRRLKAEGMCVLLDVPIAPSTYAWRLRASGRAPFLQVDRKIMDAETSAFEEADRVIAPSVFVASELKRAGVPSSKIVVIEFGVDMKEYSPHERQIIESKEKHGLDFCFIGLVNRRKGVPELLRAWSHPAFLSDRLHLCGRVFPEVRADLARAKGGRVILPGFVRPEKYLPQCDVFVFPSWLEGSAKAVFEAMACGLPVIVTESAGSIARDGIDGFVIKAGDTAALRERMIWFKENPHRRIEMGRCAQLHARAFSWERYASRIFGLYDRSGS